MRLPLACAAIAAAMGFMASSGCMSRGPRSVAAPAYQPPPSLDTEGRSPVADEPTTGFDVSGFASTLDDKALAKVKVLALGTDYANAAKALEIAFVATPPSEEDAVRWRYQLGRLRALAGDAAGAALAFEEAAKVEGPLAAYAHLGAAQGLLRTGKVDASLVHARAVPEDCAAYGASQLLVAEALQQKRDFDGAMEIWRDYLAESRHPPRWIEVVLRMADATLESRPEEARAEAAAILARRVVVEAPTSSAVVRALDLERRALALVPESRRIRAVVARGKNDTYLPTDWARSLTFDEQFTRAAALADSQNYKDAEKAIDALVAAMGSKASTTEVGCRAQVLYGSVLSKLRERQRAADAYGLAVGRCAAYPDAMVDALYFGGKAIASAGRCDEAMGRFARVERDFHDHRFADDARLRGAECALEGGDEKRYQEMLASMPVDYPEGDMVTEALFRLALRKMARREFAEAVPLLSAARTFKVKETPSSSGGRADYFEARAIIATGDVAEGRRALARVIRDYPLSYYMLHAYARLAEIDQIEAKAVLDESLAREPGSKFVIEDDEVFHGVGFARAMELLRQGESDLARRELGKLGLLKDGASSRGLWAAAAMYARAGFPQISHSFPRVRVFDWLSHYPAGRWRDAWEIAYPRPFSEVVEREAKKNGIPAALAYAVMREESAFDPEAVSPARAFGLMQLIIPTAKRVAKDVGIACDETLLSRPETNVALGCRFLADLRARFPSNPHLAIPSYNAGPGAPIRWIASRESDDFDIWVEQIPFEETRRYTKKVLASFAAYSFLYDKNGLDAAVRLPRIASQ
ncbi:MAG TPA: lytic transglycosylase domain-containing protein [Polyangiaceae bacterium]|nr:lytic transglycosylase domain-containing protein [Polyangiaceae bacterium]